MSALTKRPTALAKKQRKGILKKMRTSNKEDGATAPKKRPKPTFKQTVTIRQTSDGGNRNKSGVKGTEKNYTGDVGPEGAIKTVEQMEASNRQRDIDYVFVFTLHSYYVSKHPNTIKLNIHNYARKRQELERTRDRDAYMPTETDILTKCEQVLTELKTNDKINVKAGTSTLTIGENNVKKIWVERLKKHLLTLIEKSSAKLTADAGNTLFF